MVDDKLRDLEMRVAAGENHLQPQLQRTRILAGWTKTGIITRDNEGFRLQVHYPGMKKINLAAWCLVSTDAYGEFWNIVYAGGFTHLDFYEKRQHKRYLISIDHDGNREVQEFKEDRILEWDGKLGITHAEPHNSYIVFPDENMPCPWRVVALGTLDDQIYFMDLGAGNPIVYRPGNEPIRMEYPVFVEDQEFKIIDPESSTKLVAVEWKTKQYMDLLVPQSAAILKRPTCVDDIKNLARWYHPIHGKLMQEIPYDAIRGLLKVAGFEHHLPHAQTQE